MPYERKNQLQMPYMRNKKQTLRHIFPFDEYVYCVYANWLATKLTLLWVVSLSCFCRLAATNYIFFYFRQFIFSVDGWRFFAISTDSNHFFFQFVFCFPVHLCKQAISSPRIWWRKCTHFDDRIMNCATLFLNRWTTWPSIFFKNFFFVF